MGRAKNQNSAVAANPRYRPGEEAARWDELHHTDPGTRARAHRAYDGESLVKDEIRDYAFVDVVNSGYLRTPERGRALGTAYVDIVVPSHSHGCHAQRLLEETGGLTAEEWDSCWTEYDGVVAGLRLFPAVPARP